MDRLIDKLNGWKDVGDPEADAVVQDFVRRYAETELHELPRKIGRWEPGDDTSGLQPELVAYLQLPYALPAWVKSDVVRRAQKRYQKELQVGMIVLGVYSLPIVCLNPEVTVTLMGTGRLMQHTLRRLAETHHFVKLAMAENALLAPGPSQQWMRKVRLTHAVIRRLGLEKPHSRARPAATEREQSANWLHPLTVRQQPRNASLANGVALDQTELTWVLLTFSWVIVDGLGKLGYGLKPGEQRDHIHLWALVGHMIGIADELLPGGPLVPASEAQPLFKALLAKLLKLGDPINRMRPGALEGRLLVAALVAVLAEVQRHAVPAVLKPWVQAMPWLDAAVQNMPRMLMRRLCSPYAANMLHLGRGPLLYWVINLLALKVLDLRNWTRHVPPDLLKEWFGE